MAVAIPSFGPVAKRRDAPSRWGARRRRPGATSPTREASSLDQIDGDAHGSSQFYSLAINDVIAISFPFPGAKTPFTAAADGRIVKHVSHSGGNYLD